MWHQGCAGLAMMNVLQQQAKTVAVKKCSACDSGLLESDRFCRWCGAHQIELAVTDFASQSSTVALSEASTYTTTMLANEARAWGYRRISAPLVNAVVSSALAGHAIESGSPVLARVIVALISIPVWLIIVLLSPLDAYAAVRNLARQA
jgi:hypothetical protein